MVGRRVGGIVHADFSVVIFATRILTFRKKADRAKWMPQYSQEKSGSRKHDARANLREGASHTDVLLL